MSVSSSYSHSTFYCTIKIFKKMTCPLFTHHLASMHNLIKSQKVTRENEYLFSEKHRKAAFFPVTALFKDVWLLELAPGTRPSFWGLSSSLRRLRWHMEQLQETWPDSTGWKWTEASGCNTMILVTVEWEGPGRLWHAARVSSVIHIPFYPFMSLSTFFPPQCSSSPSFFFLLALSELEPECIRLWRTMLLSKSSHCITNSVVFFFFTLSSLTQQKHSRLFERIQGEEIVTNKLSCEFYPKFHPKKCNN